MTPSLPWERTVAGFQYAEYEARPCAGGWRLYLRGMFLFSAPTLREVETHLIGRLKERAAQAAEITRLANDESGTGHEKDTRLGREARAREQAK